MAIADRLPVVSRAVELFFRGRRHEEEKNKNDGSFTLDQEKFNDNPIEELRNRRESLFQQEIDADAVISQIIASDREIVDPIDETPTTIRHEAVFGENKTDSDPIQYLADGYELSSDVSLDKRRITEDIAKLQQLSKQLLESDDADAQQELKQVPDKYLARLAHSLVLDRYNNDFKDLFEKQRAGLELQALLQTLGIYSWFSFDNKKNPVIVVEERDKYQRPSFSLLPMDAPDFSLDSWVVDRVHIESDSSSRLRFPVTNSNDGNFNEELKAL